jgi:glucosyl-dolichyl phosphate glucuronosyltransferase
MQSTGNAISDKDRNRVIHDALYSLEDRQNRVEMPDISIIIPTFNRAAQLARTLTSIGNEVGAANPVEVIVVDNGSTDKTETTYQAVREYFPRHDWRYVYEHMPGLLSGRHCGAKEARGEILAYIDDDVVLSASWLDGLMSAFSNPEVALVGGPSFPEYEVEPPEWLGSFWHQDADGRRTLFELSLIDSGPAVRPEDPLCVPGLNFSIRKDVFDRCGGFHPDCIPAALQRYQGDGETGLTLKMKAAGFHALYHPQVAVKHVIPASRMTLESFKRRSFYQGVCDSYTVVRRERTADAHPPRSWKDVIRPLKKWIRREYLSHKDETWRIRKAMELAHAAGFAFHQREVRHDPNLLQWVTKPNYFDYALPEGWQSYTISPNADKRRI